MGYRTGGDARAYSGNQSEFPWFSRTRCSAGMSALSVLKFSALGDDIPS